MVPGGAKGLVPVPVPVPAVVLGKDALKAGQ